MISRRSVVVAALVSASPIPLQARDEEADNELLALGARFDELSRALDEDARTSDVTLAEFEEVIEAILKEEAASMQGLVVKARAACWALLGDLEVPKEGTLDQRIGVSLIRDLIRLYKPALEDPGALARLVADLPS